MLGRGLVPGVQVAIGIGVELRKAAAAAEVVSCIATRMTMGGGPDIDLHPADWVNDHRPMCGKRFAVRRAMVMWMVVISGHCPNPSSDDSCHGSYEV
jgi:hypothetical protein